MGNALAGFGFGLLTAAVLFYVAIYGWTHVADYRRWRVKRQLRRYPPRPPLSSVMTRIASEPVPDGEDRAVDFARAWLAEDPAESAPRAEEGS